MNRNYNAVPFRAIKKNKKNRIRDYKTLTPQVGRRRHQSTSSQTANSEIIMLAKHWPRISVMQSPPHQPFEPTNSKSLNTPFQTQKQTKNPTFN
jgi:hypothetical protein